MNVLGISIWTDMGVRNYTIYIQTDMGVVKQTSNVFSKNITRGFIIKTLRDAFGNNLLDINVPQHIAIQLPIKKVVP